MFRCVLFVIILVTVTSSWAQTGNFLIPCKDVPKEAALDLPDPVRRWGDVRCTIYGHTVAPRDGFIWSFPGAFAPVHLPAQMVRSEPKEIGNDAYFVDLAVEKLGTPESEKINVEFTKTLGVKPELVQDVYRLRAKNNTGGTHTVYFLTFPKGDVWGLWCNEECGRTPPFMILDMRYRK